MSSLYSSPEYEALRKDYLKARRKYYAYVREHSLVYKDWKAYLDSDEWQTLRRLALRRDGYTCQLCGEAKNLHVHHISYEHIGTARELEDIVSLCGACHDAVHQAHNRQSSRRWSRPSEIPVGDRRKLLE